MQSAKDTFYIALRDRLAKVNATRTTTVRGQTRPAVVVDENEIPDREADQGVFHLKWGQRTTDRSGALPLDILECEISYSARGGDALSVLARGRQMDAMDAELSAMLHPPLAQKMQFDATGSSPMQTNIFWCEEGQRALTVKDDTLTRVVRVAVMSYREGGER